MTIVYKYPLEERDNYVIVPTGSKFLTFQIDPRGMPSVWFHCDKDVAGTDTYMVRLHLTGEDIDVLGFNYIGTLIKGPIVVHAFSQKQ